VQSLYVGAANRTGPRGANLGWSWMVDRIQIPIALPRTVEEQLSEEDDPALWTQVLRTVAEDASVLQAANNRAHLYAEVGVCSHWLRPHQTRWTAAGGFAFPIGYGHAQNFGRHGLPNFDWRVILQFNPALVNWSAPSELPAKRFRSVRIAIPARTTRHCQAAVHTLWSPRTLDARLKRIVLYGFRNLSGVWALKARSKEPVCEKHRHSDS
jgi:hypothetical protein